MIFSKRCYNGGERHKFEPRYDEAPSDCKFKGASGFDLRRLLFYDIYVKDVCVWCGKEIKK